MDLFAAVPEQRSYHYMLVMENVLVTGLHGEAVQSRSARYESITLGVDKEHVAMVFDIQQRVKDGQFRDALRAPDHTDSVLEQGQGPINPAVLERLKLD